MPEKGRWGGEVEGKEGVEEGKIMRKEKWAYFFFRFYTDADMGRVGDTSGARWKRGGVRHQRATTIFTVGWFGGSQGVGVEKDKALGWRAMKIGP
eukprot:757896-Hanusia_phi.AAC.6